ncbi:GNAT family N-acetyltransferase [Luteimonas sp. S4-F44]|uniref:GNAT family N-acetyltransferase n=1 Tax=Luteimonas sp. S4-F44 TaxID=2925842 RepID=UPI001F53421C|nr:GNAT family N-acetyltransferase [Luteimonas sp. S4-F44]UNK41817.1 GNAT family N-acetyltransferase [Luteimonas sp. S4-F44]
MDTNGFRSPAFQRADSATLRRATVDDAATLSRLAARTFTETFGHLYPPQDLADFLADAYAVEKQRTILAHPDYAVWLLDIDGQAVGHAAAGPCGLPHAEVAPGDGELKRLYLVRGLQGASLGARLMQTAMDWLLRDGPRTLWVGVWSENLGAQRFYGRYGFGKVGEYLFPVGATQDLEFILRRPAQH